MAKILVVEDEPNNLELALRIVRHAGHEATVATDGFAALELAREHRPQLILLDLQLPKLDGWTVVKLLRKETWAKQVPIVAVSASASPGDEHKAIEAGCTAFLSKPYYPAALREMLSQYGRSAPGGPCPRSRRASPPALSPWRVMEAEPTGRAAR